MIRMVEPTGLDSAERERLAEDARPSSRDAIIGITRAGIVSSWNPPAVLLYGYLMEEMVGSAADVLCPPESRAREAEIMQRIIAGGNTERLEADRVCKDGTLVSVSLTIAPVVDESGAITGVSAASWKVGGRQGGHDQVEAGIESERRNSRDTQDRFDLKVDTERRDSRDAQEQFEQKVNSQRRDSREAQIWSRRRLRESGATPGSFRTDPTRDATASAVRLLSEMSICRRSSSRRSAWRTSASSPAGSRTTSTTSSR
jgi:PAS domain S-box-containing protein